MNLSAKFILTTLIQCNLRKLDENEMVDIIVMIVFFLLFILFLYNIFFISDM